MSTAHEVGTTAGEIYAKFSGAENHTPLSKIVKTVNKDPRLVALALGWLLREGKADIRRDGAKMMVKVLK